MTTIPLPQPDGRRRDVLRFEPPPEGWRPPDEAGRAILRVVLAVKERRDSDRKDAA